ncbi:phage tail sheath family protein [Actinoplanes awajinensis]|uniref:Uncharacterized protein n=1 Tax=Actinoplanes awajinensis subsp. mycoplanecinus TaxID=135947 RepID=A0A101JEY1_9ACTN|nr:phage tail sheath subtilisin-like domain-containing protein [Actinoplanes awajinensis]KUL25591.1 hypothetical protein ADL15_40310 [Actinoplanes awajinensis subsp. mycoplanecinus]
MSLNLGINVIETDGRAVPSIEPAPTSVAGFIVRTQRGVLRDQPVMVTSWRQFQEQFGGYVPGAYGAYAVRGFFDNGGSTAWITRVTNEIPAAVAAHVDSAKGPWDLGDSTEVTVSAEQLRTSVKVLFTGTPAVLDGGAGPFDLRSPSEGQDQTLDLTVNGRDLTYRFTAEHFGDLAAVTVEAVAAALNRDLPGIQAWTDARGLHLRTDRRGKTAELASGGTAAATLGLSPVAKAKDNVGDLARVDAAEAVEVFSRALDHTDLSVFADDGRVVIAHPTPGSTHTLQVQDAQQRFGFVSHAGSDGTDGTQVARPSWRAWTLDGQTVLTVRAGYRGAADPGKWGSALRVIIGPAKAGPELLDLEVQRLRPGMPPSDSEAYAAVETWPALSPDPADRRWIERVLNNSSSGSRFITVASTAGVTVPVPPAPVSLDLDQGADDAFATGRTAAAYKNAMDRFATVPIQLLCCPESDDSQVIAAGLAHCATQGDRMFVGHSAAGDDATAARAFAQEQRADKVYGALYFPWIMVADPGSGEPMPIPPDGHVLGVYARTERERGVWKAPAGNAAQIVGALGVAAELSDVDHTDLVTNASLNAIRYLPGLGIVIDSSRTLSTNTLWRYVSVRLLFNFVKSSLRTGLRWTVQEPITEALWRRVEHNTVRPFLMGLWRRGAFGPGTPEQVFDVKCDAENNPPADVQQGRLTVEVYFYPSRPAETVVITVGQQEGGGSATES